MVPIRCQFRIDYKQKNSPALKYILTVVKITTVNSLLTSFTE